MYPAPKAVSLDEFVILLPPGAEFELRERFEDPKTDALVCYTCSVPGQFYGSRQYIVVGPESAVKHVSEAQSLRAAADNIDEPERWQFATEYVLKAGCSYGPPGEERRDADSGERRE